MNGWRAFGVLAAASALLVTTDACNQLFGMGPSCHNNLGRYECHEQPVSGSPSDPYCDPRTGCQLGTGCKTVDCWKITDQSACEAMTPCAWTGTDCMDSNPGTDECYAQTSEQGCTARAGCIWTDKDCHGARLNCRNFEDEGACKSDPDCDWWAAPP